MTKVSNEARAQKIAKAITTQATAALQSAGPKDQTADQLQALGRTLFSAGFALRDPQAGLLPAPVRKAYERLVGLAYQVDKQQDFVVALARGFHAKGSNEVAALAAEKASALAAGRLPLTGVLGDQQQRAIDRYVEKVSVKGQDVRVTVTGDASSYDLHEVLAGVARLHPGKSIAIASQHGAVVEDFPGGAPRPFMRDPAAVSGMVGMLTTYHPGVKSAAFVGDALVVRVNDMFDAGDAKDLAKTARILLGDQAAVRVVRHTQGELPSFVVTKGYLAQVYPDGTKSANVAYTGVPDELKRLGVKEWDSWFGRGITLRMPDTATAAEALHASQTAARITGSDYAQVWFSGHPSVSSTGESLAAPVRVTKADREAFAQGLLDAHPLVNSTSFYGAWPEPKDGDRNAPAFKAELTAFLEASQREGFVDAQGIVVHVEPWFDAATVKGLVDDVRARAAALPGFDADKAKGLLVDVRRKIDGSEVNRGKGGWAVTAQTLPGPEPRDRFTGAKQ